MPRLDAPLSYRMAPQSGRDEASNGCGAAGWKVDLVPDNLLGVDITEACAIHDWDYAEGTQEMHRVRADRRFHRNMKTLIKEEGGPAHLRWGRLCLAWWYFRGVRKFGAAAFGS